MTADEAPALDPRESLAAALAAFQADLPEVPKNATGQVPGKRDHKYADIADLNRVVLPRLAKYGLSWSMKPMLDEHGRFVLRYTLRHAPTGEVDTGDYELTRGTNWETGSGITYGRRYCLEAVVGVAATEDDDGRAAAEASRSHATPQRRQQPEPTREMTVADARGYLGQAAKDNRWDLDILAARYQEQYGEHLGDATDPARIIEFRDALFARSDIELQAARNGAES